MKLIKACLENSLRPLYEGLSGIRYTQVTQKRVLIGVVRATWTTATRRRRDGDQTARRGGNTGKALGSGNTGQLRRLHGVRSTVDSQVTYRRVLIGVVHAT
jgi:hypothetical protein